MTTQVKPINKCEKCGCEILDGDRLCIDCYKNKFALRFGVFFVLWIATAVITFIIFETMITFGVWWFWFLLFPYVAKKSRFITKRKMYYSVPVTLEELAPKLLKEPEIEKRYRKKYGYDEEFKFSSKYFALYVQDHIYKDLAHCKSNKLADHPNYIPFVRDGSISTADLICRDKPYTTITSASEPVDIFTKSQNKINKKPFIAVIAVLSTLLICLSAFSVYQYTSYSKLKEEYHSLDTKYADLLNKHTKVQSELLSTMSELSSYQKYAVFVNDDSTYYHTYKCTLQRGTFRIHNVSAAESLGYQPCPVCRD